MGETYPDDEYLLGLVDEEDNNAYTPSLRGGSDDVGQNQVEYVEETVPNWLQFTIAVGVWLLAAFIIKTTCYRMYILKKKISPQCEQNRFEHEVSEAKKEMSSSENRTSTCTSADSSQTVIYQNYDGDFYIKYDDCGKTRSGFMKIQMKNSDIGYDIEGMCADADGYATITDGHVTYSGEAWWIQEVLGEDEEKRGLQVISRGNFDLPNNTFEGEWVSNSGKKGCYSKFEAKNVIAATSTSATSKNKKKTLDVPLAIAIPQ